LQEWTFKTELRPPAATLLLKGRKIKVNKPAHYIGRFLRQLQAARA
jgi:hypothetical protein